MRHCPWQALAASLAAHWYLTQHHGLDLFGLSTHAQARAVTVGTVLVHCQTCNQPFFGLPSPRMAPYVLPRLHHFIHGLGILNRGFEVVDVCLVLLYLLQGFSSPPRCIRRCIPLCSAKQLLSMPPPHVVESPHRALGFPDVPVAHLRSLL